MTWRNVEARDLPTAAVAPTPSWDTGVTKRKIANQTARALKVFRQPTTLPLVSCPIKERTFRPTPSR